jgi:hypothetical protein
MAANPFIKLTAGRAAEICAWANLKPDALRCLGENMTPRDFVEALIAKRLYVAGIDFLAHALPAREGVWWGCLCLQHAIGSALTPEERAAAIAAVQWVFRPGEDTRIGAKPAADTAGAANPAGALAAAAFQSGGNVAPPNMPPMAPPPFSAAKAVATSIKLCATKSPPVKMLDTQRCYVELGIGMAEGRYL